MDNSTMLDFNSCGIVSGSDCVPCMCFSDIYLPSLPSAEAIIGLSDTKLRPDKYLSGLSNDPDFLAFATKAALDASASTPPVLFRVVDISRCLKGLYHTLSKAQHGMNPGFISVSVDSSMAENDRFAIRLFFEFFGISYNLVDANDQIIMTNTALARSWTSKSIVAFVPK